VLKKIFFACMSAAMVTGASAAPLALTTSVPACAGAARASLPEAYLAAATHSKDFAWVKHAKLTDTVVGGNGYERFDGSNLHDWFQFQRIDLNNDGRCDWFVTMQAPDSSGGDHDSINTLYLGQPGGWLRLGATIPQGQVDTLGIGKTMEEQSSWLFGDEMVAIHDSGANINYVVTWLSERAAQRILYPGYRVYAWDKRRSTLALLDKWQPGSNAAQVYEYFKAHGGWSPTQATPISFDALVEAFEIQVVCDKNDPSALAGAAQGLLARCGIDRQ
jgi:hypothetical protein